MRGSLGNLAIKSFLASLSEANREEIMEGCLKFNNASAEEVEWRLASLSTKLSNGRSYPSANHLFVIPMGYNFDCSPESLARIYNNWGIASPDFTLLLEVLYCAKSDGTFVTNCCTIQETNGVVDAKAPFFEHENTKAVKEVMDNLVSSGEASEFPTCYLVCLVGVVLAHEPSDMRDNGLKLSHIALPECKGVSDVAAGKIFYSIGQTSFVPSARHFVVTPFGFGRTLVTVFCCRQDSW